MYVTIYQFYDIKIIPSTNDIIEINNLLIQALFVESLRPTRSKRLSLYVFPIITHTIYIYIHTYIHIYIYTHTIGEVRVAPDGGYLRT